ncbi:MAG: T9SS type A sorting domain-containing protein [Bacteroidota bacterium]
MKELFRIAGVIALMVLGGQLSAQICTPDTASFPNSGIYPLSLDQACVGQVYEQVLTINVPVDTMISGFPLSIPVDWVRLDSVLGLPPGFTVSCVPDSCSFAGGTSGCVVISGVPTAVDTFFLDLAVTGQGTFGGPIVLSDTFFNYYAIVVNPSPDIMLVSQTDESCGGAEDGSLSVDGAGGVGPLEYSIDAGASWQSDSVFAGLTMGNYEILVRDSLGCTGAVNAVVGAMMDPIAIDTAIVEQITCFGENNGVISLTVDGGNENFSFSWNTMAGDTTPAIDSLGPGGYLVTVTDSNGCQKVEDFVIEEPDSLGITLSASNDNGVANGTASVTASGGTPSYDYMWSTGDTTESIAGLASGWYTVTVTDELGCSVTDSVEVLLAVSIGDNLFSHFDLYPNPNNGAFTLSLELSEAEVMHLQLMDMKGQLLWQDNTARVQHYKSQIHIEGSAAGIYLLQIRTKTGMASKKVVVH